MDLDMSFSSPLAVYDAKDKAVAPSPFFSLVGGYATALSVYIASISAA
jgi:hypothetical protein